MMHSTRVTFRWIAAGLFAAATMGLGSGCANSGTQTTEPSSPLVAGQPAAGQALFPNDQAAFDAMMSAVKAEDHERIHQLLGPGWKELTSGDKTEDAAAFKEFAQRAAEYSSLNKQDADTSIIEVGKDHWPFPIPIQKSAAGQWFFDTEAGKTEILARRIGENELDAIEFCQTYVKAQREYAGQDHDGSGVLKYAQRMISTPGHKDGLYWDAQPDESPSPFGELIGKMTADGYEPTTTHPRGLYRGYRFRILKRQGSDAPGGKYDYIINGNMLAGFAMVAYPIDYGQSGIMTFVVNQNGKIYQKDLGQQTTDLGQHLREYDPDSSWALVKE